MITIGDKLIKSIQLVEQDLRQTTAVLLLERGILSMYAARKISGLEKIASLDYLSTRQVSITGTITDVKHDVELLEK